MINLYFVKISHTFYLHSPTCHIHKIRVCKISNYSHYVHDYYIFVWIIIIFVEIIPGMNRYKNAIKSWGMCYLFDSHRCHISLFA